MNHFSEKSNNEETVIAFVKNKAIERQYHTFFSWRDRNANQFFGLFGSAFKTFMIAKVRSDNKLKIAIEAFMELGELRNSIVHRDYATFPLDKTVDEIYSLYRKALFFVLSIPLELRRFSDPAFSSK